MTRIRTRTYKKRKASVLSAVLGKPSYFEFDDSEAKVILYGKLESYDQELLLVNSKDALYIKQRDALLGIVSPKPRHRHEFAQRLSRHSPDLSIR